ncbi:MAG: ABC transporter ATP-binding protein [PVC group bacterium]
MSGNTPLLSLTALDFRYPGGFSLRIPSLELADGVIHALSGPNGAGKTTLLHILALLLPAGTDGYRYRGQPLPKTPRQQLDIRRSMTLVEQNPCFFRATIGENIAYGLRLRRWKERDIRKAVAAAGDDLGIGSLLDRKPDRLSAGEKQKAALARALVLRPEILFLDEPTANVDRQSVSLIEEAVKGFHRKRGGTAVWATHNLRQAFRVGDRVMSLVNGKLAPGTIDNLFAGRVEKRGEESIFYFGPGLSAVVPSSNEGTARMLILPEEIIVSPEPLQSSARNCFPGRVVGMEERGSNVAVLADIGVPITALITPPSYRKLGLHLSSKVYISFKATAASVF